MKVYDAENRVLGRLASMIAKELLEGEEEIRVVNAEKAFITGKKKNIFDKYRENRERGKQMNGPYFPRRPERIFKRTVRGMLPHRQPRGRKAFKRFRAYIGVPDEFKDEDIQEPDVKSSRGKIGVDLSEVSEYLGAEF